MRPLPALPQSCHASGGAGGLVQSRVALVTGSLSLRGASCTVIGSNGVITLQSRPLPHGFGIDWFCGLFTVCCGRFCPVLSRLLLLQSTWFVLVANVITNFASCSRDSNVVHPAASDNKAITTCSLQLQVTVVQMCTLTYCHSPVLAAVTAASHTASHVQVRLVLSSLECKRYRFGNALHNKFQPATELQLAT